MTVESHLAELERRHRALEAKLEEAMLHPGVDALEVSEIKRQKLSLKDEIVRLKEEAIH